MRYHRDTSSEVHEYLIRLPDRGECSFQNLLSWNGGAIRRL